MNIIKTENKTNVPFKTELLIEGHNFFESSTEDNLMRCGDIVVIKDIKCFVFVCMFCNQQFSNGSKFSKHIGDVHWKAVESPRSPSPAVDCYLDEVKIEDDEEDKFYQPDFVEIIEDKESYIEELSINGFDEYHAEEYIDVPSVEAPPEDISDNDFVEDSVNDQQEAESDSDIFEVMDVVKNDLSECPACGLKVKDLKRHQAMHANDSRYKCQICDKTFRNKHSLKDHILVHGDERPYKCEICGHGFKNKVNLTVHIRRHKGDKPFVCQLCEKRWNTSTELKIHMRFHTGERPYICDQCGKGYPTSSALTGHKLRHANVRRHKCDECGKAFFCGTQLRDHQAKHSSDRNFVCDLCDATFSRKKALVQHRKIHSAVKEYECDICGKRFAQRAGVYSHKKCAHGLMMTKTSIDEMLDQ